MPYPCMEDEEAYDGIGMLIYDKKLARIIDFAEKAEGCIIEGNDVTIRPNARIGVYVSQVYNDQTNKLANNIDHFSAGFMAPSELDGVAEEFDSEFEGDALPDDIA